MQSDYYTRLKAEIRLDKEQGWLFGVCAGVASYFRTEPALIRVGTIIAGLFFPKLTIAVYLVAWLLLNRR